MLSETFSVIFKHREFALIIVAMPIPLSLKKKWKKAESHLLTEQRLLKVQKEEIQI